MLFLTALVSRIPKRTSEAVRDSIPPPPKSPQTNENNRFRMLSRCVAAHDLSSSDSNPSARTERDDKNPPQYNIRPDTCRLCMRHPALAHNHFRPKLCFSKRGQNLGRATLQKRCQRPMRELGDHGGLKNRENSPCRLIGSPLVDVVGQISPR